jgi:hypothetical protein
MAERPAIIKTIRKAVYDAKRKQLATKAARKSVYEAPYQAKADFSNKRPKFTGSKKLTARVSTGSKAPRKQLATKAARKSTYDPMYPKAYDLTEEESDEDATDDDVSILSDSFDIHDLNEEEKMAAKAEHGRVDDDYCRKQRRARNTWSCKNK